MSDLYSGLINSNLRKGQGGEEFWGLFNSLDRPGPPSVDFLKLQIAELQNLENSSEGRYAEANRFLQQAQANLAQSPTVEDAINDQVYNRIIELLNAGLRGSSVNPYRKIATKGIDPAVVEATKQGEISKVLNELTTLLEQIQVSPELSTQMVDTLERRLKTFNWNDPTPHDYIMEKADLIEELMVDRMNQNPGLRAIVTGKWTDVSGKQLIEDAFAFSTKEINIPFSMGKLSFSIKTSKGVEEANATSIQDFLNQLDQLNGTKYTVKLSNELYTALQAGAALAGQAKSGMAGQNILNMAKGKNARNSLTLEQVKFNPMALWDLYQLDQQTKTEYFKPKGQQHSETLAALANYHLSLAIGETALAKNQVYLTADGFVTASQWMEKYQKYLIFTPDVISVGPEFLTEKRPYNFNS